MEIASCGNTQPGIAHRHAGARRRIEHPCGNYQDDIRADLNVDNVLTAPLFDVPQSNAATIQRVPAI